MTARRRIAVVTTSRADFGLYRPLLLRLAADEAIDLQLVAGGMHLAPEFGLTVRAIEEEGFAIAERVELLLSSDTATGTAASMGLGVIGFGKAFERLCPEIVVVLGDRFEMHAAAVAAQPFRVAVAHIHGGELTLGAMDDALRHSMTKMAHLHFVSTETYARRVAQMGEEPWRITVSGAPGLDNLALVEPLADTALEVRLGLPLEPPPLVVTYHPTTREGIAVEVEAQEVLAGIDAVGLPAVFTAPNADHGGRRLLDMIRAYVADHDQAVLVDSLGTAAYFGLMASASVMVGNSSSGIIEAASFKLPVVNIGGREEGRLRPRNVIDVACEHDAIAAAIRRAADPAFRAGLADLRNPYAGDRPAAEVIHRRLGGVEIGEALLKKAFVDLPDGAADGRSEPA